MIKRIRDSVQKIQQSSYTFRLRAPKGLDETLIKELNYLGLDKNNGSLKKIEGRKAVEIKGTFETMWQILFRSRIAEDLQVRMTQGFKARGEDELRSNLHKLPWDCYLPIKQFQDFKLPQIRAKSHQSKLFHEKMVREIFLQEVNDLPIYKEYNTFKKQQAFNKGLKPISFSKFKKQWLADMQKQIDLQIKEQALNKTLRQNDSQDNQIQLIEESDLKNKFKTLDQIRNELHIKADLKNEKKKQGKILLNIVKDHGEVLLSTSYDDLHNHGYKPYMRWGVLKETLTAACILESGILERARQTGKLHVWDPFCGSGSFIIELLQMILGRPCRSLDEEMAFENWPIHDQQIYDNFKKEIEEFKSVNQKDKIDIWLIGSDISQKAIQQSENNLKYGNVDQYFESQLFIANNNQRIDSPFVYQSHWPKQENQMLRLDSFDNLNASDSIVENPKNNLQLFKKNQETYLSLYQGSYENIGIQLQDITNNFKNFCIISNIPYGVQSALTEKTKNNNEKFKENHVKTIQNLYRGIGHFLDAVDPEKDVQRIKYWGQSANKQLRYESAKNLHQNGVYIVSQSVHYGHEMSFQKFSNTGWDPILHFSNGGLSVNLLKWDRSKVSRQRQMLEAYEDLDQRLLIQKENNIKFPKLKQQNQITDHQSSIQKDQLL